MQWKGNVKDIPLKRNRILSVFATRIDNIFSFLGGFSTFLINFCFDMIECIFELYFHSTEDTN